MKSYRLAAIIAMVAIGSLLLACSEQKQTAEKAAPEKAKVESLATTPADIKKEAGDLAKTTMTYAEEQKNLYMQEAVDRLGQYNQKMSELDSKLAMLSDQAKAEMMAEVSNFEKKKEAVAAKIREMDAARGDAYKDLQEGMHKAIAEMEKAYDQAMNRFEK